MHTTDLIEAIREDIRQELRAEILAEILPVIEKNLYANIFNFKEATKYLKISDATLRRQVRDKEVPYFMQRGQYFFRQLDLDRSIEQRIQRANKKGIS